MRRATGDLSPLSVLGRVPSYPGSDGAAPDLLLRRLDSNSSVATSEASSMLERSASMRDSHGDASAPVSRTSSLQHARRSLHDGRNGDSSLEHTPPRVMRSVSAPGSGVKDDASTRSISSDTVRKLLDVPGLNSQRRRPPQEVANEQQARDMDIPIGVNLQRSASPGEIHRRVRDERMTQRLRQYEEHEAYQRDQRERHLRRQARRLAKAEGRSLESSPSGVSIGSTACSSDPGSPSPASPRIVGPEASPGQNGRAADAADGGLFGEYAHVLDAKDLQEMAEDNKLMEERVDVLIRELRIWQTRLDISAVRTRGAIAATQDMLAAETARARTDIAAICDKSDRAVIKGVSKISEKVEAVRLPTLGGIEEEALWGEAAQSPAEVPRLPLASVLEGQAGLPATSAASAVPARQQQQQQQPQQAGRQQAATFQRDSDDSLRSWNQGDETSAAQPGGLHPVSTGKSSFTFAQAPLRT